VVPEKNLIVYKLMEDLQLLWDNKMRVWRWFLPDIFVWKVQSMLEIPELVFWRLGSAAALCGCHSLVERSACMQLSGRDAF